MQHLFVLLHVDGWTGGAKTMAAMSFVISKSVVVVTMEDDRPAS